jgi:hypothetical protein
MMKEIFHEKPYQTRVNKVFLKGGYGMQGALKYRNNI